MEILELPNFIDRYRQDPAKLREAAPGLFSLLPGNSEPEDLSVALERARRYYQEHKYVKVLASLDQGLRALSGSAIERPKKGRLSDDARLLDVANLLILWEKSCTWLNIAHDNGLLSWRHYLDDINIIYEALGDSEAAAGLRSSYAYRYLQAGRLSSAINEIENGLSKARKLSTVRFLTEAKASLARKVDEFPKALKLYEKVRLLDDRIPDMSQASRALSMAWLGILQGRGSGRARIKGLNLALEALELCRMAGHIGFQAQILFGLIASFIDSRDYEGARETLSDLRSLLSEHQNSFPGLFARAEQLALVLESVEYGDRLHSLPSNGELERLIFLVSWEPLRSVLRACLREALAESPYLSRALLCLAAELVTEVLFEGKCPDATIKEQEKTLQKKNNKLLEIGVYSGHDFSRMELLRKARNKVAHGVPGDLEVRSIGRSVDLLKDVMWLVKLLQSNGLLGFVPKGSKSERMLDDFLGPV